MRPLFLALKVLFANFSLFRNINICSDIGLRAARHAVEVGSGTDWIQRRIARPDSRRFLPQAVVEDILVPDCMEKRIGIPDAPYKIIIVGAGTLEQTVAEEYSGTGKIAVRQVGTDTVDD